MGLWDFQSPMAQGGLLLNRQYTVQTEAETRTTDRSSQVSRTAIGTVMAGEPQMLDRATTSLMTIADVDTLQNTPYKILTDETALLIRKGMVLTDSVTGDSYRVMFCEVLKTPAGNKYNLLVSDLND